ncbi:MAG TPA: PH domain-containing protein, partial [Thermomicrobiaceae bacterium]|nr:PH domain-containing protein [Thermomicrobiaceae bacterium]
IALIAIGAYFGSTHNRLFWIIAAVAVIPAGYAFVRYLHWHHELYYVTNFRIIQVEGVINKRILDSSLEKVNDILLTQSFFGRVFNYGTLEILTASEIGVNKLDALDKPFDFKRAIIDALNRLSGDYQNARIEPSAPAHDGDMHELLAQLDSLREAGVLSDEEYREKRSELTGTQGGGQ